MSQNSAERELAGYITDKDWKPFNGQILVIKTAPEFINNLIPFGIVEGAAHGRQKFLVRPVRFDKVRFTKTFTDDGIIEDIELIRVVPNPEEGRFTPICTKPIECKYSRARLTKGWVVRPYDEGRGDYTQLCHVAEYDATRNHLI